MWSSRGNDPVPEGQHTGQPQATLTSASSASIALDPVPVGRHIEVTLGETVGRYQVRRELGRGGMGRVYLARDVVLGRSVALKVVGPDRAGGLSTERFLHEARAIARLNHPHVVQLYDFGEYKGGLYLALEYVDGTTLRERARAGGGTLDEVLRYARAIADGLAHAHAAGVYHCDLKPGNVMVGKDGRVRVVDFGIARTGENAPGTRSGTPDWMAPEQRLGAALTDRVDSWALGIVTAQLLTGSHPLGDDTELRHDPDRALAHAATWRIERRDVPEPVVELIRRSLQHQPSLRPSAAEWARVLDSVLVDRSDVVVDDGPYRGLAPFDEKHARFYFGRELEIDAFVERLRDTPHLPIVGPSGAGKSSFLHAGVIPRLRAREPWTVIAFRPGADPAGALARHVLAAIDDRRGERRPTESQIKGQVHAFRAELLETPTLLAARLATIANVHGTRVLLAVDQLEEAFTQGASEAERDRFLQMLVLAVDDPLDPVRVVVTVRDDFVGKLAGLRSLFVVKKLGVDDVRRTITGPLERYGYEFDDPAIVDDLIAEVGNAEAAKLPLLQFACRKLWDGRDAGKRLLLRATYRDMGGLAGALAKHADHALEELSPEELRIARRLLLLLVVGTTRRSVLREQLVSAVGPSADAVLDRLLSARLLVQRNQGTGEAPIIEIAHESLVQTWSQLARWLDESREERHLLEELDEAARIWERRGRRSEDTWSEKDLSTGRHRAVQLGLALTPRVAEFFAAGDQRHEAARRRKRVRYGAALAIAVAAALPVLFLIGRYQLREEMIDNNLGTVDLTLIPFDWSPGLTGGAVVAGISAAPALSVALHAATDDVNAVGPPIPDRYIRKLAFADVGVLRTQRIQAPGGTLFLRVDGRGRPGQRCAPSWIRIQQFPGFRSDEIRSIVLWVPTCDASAADTVVIEKGRFVYGGPGEPPSKQYGEIDHTEAEITIDLEAFAIDRTEVSNLRYQPFGHLESITGYPAPVYPETDAVSTTGAPTYPVTYVSAIEAEAYCAYLGKRLPSDYQWTKAARGGQTIAGRPNPHPRRLYPWGTAARPECVNIQSEHDGFPWTAPVDAFSCGDSPYGVRQLAGNVQEWIARDGQTDRASPMHIVRGGGPNSPPELDQGTTIFRNPRSPRSYTLANGFRCVTPEPTPQ